MIKFFVGSISEELPAKQFEVVPACKRKVGGLRAELESMWKVEAGQIFSCFACLL
ncbi:hypothetical protein NC651_009675 [Populus alba x Populus x berolinensis]|nr:hypothetical protein NC651_009675 [Populus alba x Populus x berolinensis]